jgi:hypothetical protein
MRQSLAAVARNFEELHEQRAELAKIWGSRAMCNVMGDFADNWTTHREKLREHIEELRKRCEVTAQWFHDVDAGVASALGVAAEAPR